MTEQELRAKIAKRLKATSKSISYAEADGSNLAAYFEGVESACLWVLRQLDGQQNGLEHLVK